ncbi:MAG: rhodanese-like domain-containing protein [Chthonomonadales bacterium]
MQITTWTIITGLATVVSTIAYIVTALFIRAELKALEKERYLTVTSELFSIWQTAEFMEAQFWVMHKLNSTTWEDFIMTHRGDFGELAFHRVGSYYDRVGTLVRLGMISEFEILSTIAAYAIAAWSKMAPLVHEARKLENSNLFDDFEKLLPSCHECYVPNLAKESKFVPFAIGTKKAEPKKPDNFKRMSIGDLKKRVDKGKGTTVLDVRQPKHVLADPFGVPGALRVPPDEIKARLKDIPAGDDIVSYCNCPAEETSGAVSTFLQENGRNAFALTGGFEAWKSAGYPVEPTK